MESKATVDVRLAMNAYSITVAQGLLSKLSTTVSDLLDTRSLSNNHAIIITEDHVGPLYLDKVATELQTVFSRLDTVVVPAGENSKSVSELDGLWQQLLASHANRDSIVIALGGGVIGDLAGFVAASFMRGVPLLQIPTSLLAQVDSSVGGKVGINLPGGKNMVGAFWQPLGVLIDPAVLKTLSPRDYRCGLAEVIKYGIIMDADFFELLESSVSKIQSQDLNFLPQMIARCCQLKADVVTEDERETSGRRAILNYGHTFGHAIENVAGYGEFSHGEAISIGMHCAAKVAHSLKMVDASFVQRQADLLTAVGLPIELNQPSDSFVEQLILAMQHDKKTIAGQLRLILPNRIGAVELVPAPPLDLLRDSFRSTT